MADASRRGHQPFRAALARATSARVLAATMLATLAFATSQREARALPGQTVAQFSAWARAKPLLARTFASEIDRATRTPRFEVNDRAGWLAWYLRAQTDGVDPEGRIVTREVLSLHAAKPGQPAVAIPISHDGTGAGFAAFVKLFGADVAWDFQHSVLVAAPSGMSDASDGPPHPVAYAFYRGAKYSYIWNGGPEGQLILQTHTMSEKYDAKTIGCIKAPATCNA